MKCVGITDGSAGMVAQVEALAIALDMPIEMRVIALPKIINFLPNKIFEIFPFLFFLLSKSLVLSPQSPDLIISCGRKAALCLAAIKRKNPEVKAIHIQDPQMSSKFFNLVIAMEHDKIVGDNVIKTKFALHKITPEIIEKAREKFAPVFAIYPKPHIAVLLGGTTNKYNLTKARMEYVIWQIKQKLDTTESSLLITPSRRTGEENIAALQEAFVGNSRVYIYDGVSENPYLGMLAIADEIMVSNDSVNMMSEAFATGKKIIIIDFPEHKDTKPSRFAEMIKKEKNIDYKEMEKLAEEVKRRVFS